MSNVITILEQLLQSSPSSEPHYIRVTEWFADDVRNTPETEALWADFICQYQAIIQEITMIWGSPQFEGTWDDPGFPDWHHWVLRLAYWQIGNAIAYVECDQQDSETPMMLSIGTKACEELDEDNT
jgi:hypothetical protein